MTRPRLFVELCCGSAAVTLKLLGGRHAVPPISYMGSKRGYAVAILGAMGLRSGIGADSVLLCDAGPWAHVWAVLADPGRCAEVAAILRGWADEDPRKLWERLRDEHKGTWAEWTAERTAAYLQINASNRLMNVDRNASGEWKNTGQGGTTFGGCDFATAASDVAGRVESSAAWLTVNAWSGGGRVSMYQGPGRPSSVHAPGAAVCIEREGIAKRCDSVAAWIVTGAWCYRQGDQSSGGPILPGERRQDTTATATATAKASSAAAGCQVVSGMAEDIDPPADCSGVYVYMDPDYQGTTGYSATMPRETVLSTARKWSDAGAVVCVSEAVPLPLDGWHHVEITGARVGQKRVFSKQQREWLTMNREPAYVPATQREMFA
jgi:hypothetical protein